MLKTVDTSAFTNTFVALEAFEKGLNVVGYVPLLGSLASAVRSYYARIEMVAGIALAIFSLTQNDASQTIFFTVGVTFMGHSLLNFGRAILEAFPTVPLFTCLPYDLYATFIVGKRFFSYL